jgi:hypothetical protein
MTLGSLVLIFSFGILLAGRDWLQLPLPQLQTLVFIALVFTVRAWFTWFVSEDISAVGEPPFSSRVSGVAAYRRRRKSLASFYDESSTTRSPDFRLMQQPAELAPLGRPQRM